MQLSSRLKPEPSRLYHYKFMTTILKYGLYVPGNYTSLSMSLIHSPSATLHLSHLMTLLPILSRKIQAIRRKVLPAPTTAFIHLPVSESICSALHPVTMNWSRSYARPTPSLLHQILSVFLTPVCLNIPPTMLPAFFWSSIFPFLLDHYHQHQICLNFSHLKINKTKTQTLTYIHIPLQY